jgi:hypothetical protein
MLSRQRSAAGIVVPWDEGPNEEVRGVIYEFENDDESARRSRFPARHGKAIP